MEVREVLKVKDSALFTAHPSTLLSEAVIMMAENDIGAVVVMEAGKLVGMLTFREVLRILAKRQTERREGPTPPIAEILVGEAVVVAGLHQAGADRHAGRLDEVLLLWRVGGGTGVAGHYTGLSGERYREDEGAAAYRRRRASRTTDRMGWSDHLRVASR